MMNQIFDTVTALTSNPAISIDKSLLVQRFARELGWTPSYDLYPAVESDFVNIHLIVEHGLEDSAVLSFLTVPYNSLSETQRRTLLNISYNNLVDWHIHIDREKATYVYNRSSSLNNVIEEVPFRNEQFEGLRNDAFEKVIGKRLSPNIPTLDDALISTISYWKRAISADLDNKVSNENLSALFNAIIFIRAIEDNIKRYERGKIASPVLIDACNQYTGLKNFTGVIAEAQKVLGKEIPKYLLNSADLKVFDSLNKQTISYLIADFYQNRAAGFYNYDFSIMSMHALSRIYERYSAILKVEESNQFTLFAKLPQEEVNKAFGAVYTPQYIARFFGKYLKQNLPPSLFYKMRIAEPSVGSGIFLRSILEIKCDPRIEENSIERIKNSFQDILGLDVDANACQASTLSLALLQLVLTSSFPERLNIIQAETIEFISKNPSNLNSFDAVVSNPPFIATDILSKELKDRVTEYLGDFAKGRTDTYLAFLKVGIDLLKPGGFGLFVLPHSFLIAENAIKLRKYISDNCWIRCLTDLSAIPVFGNTGIYVVLFIFQKKHLSNLQNPLATMIKCREFVGKALQDGLRNNHVENNFYSVFEVEQNFFKSESWAILPLKELKLREKLSQFPKLSDFIEIRQGFVTGADEIFVIDKIQIPKGEEGLYIPYLPDRQIDRYSIPKTVSQYVFYPFDGQKKIDEKEIKRDYPGTWKYLQSKKKAIQSKKSFQNVNDWWRPLRTRQPEHILSPKIVTPHLSIVPKFAVDIQGKYGISRSPYFILKGDEGGKEMLLYFLGLLNSTPCYWYISNHSHKYSRGYTMLEVKTLNQTPVPDPSQIPNKDFKKMVELVERRIKSSALDGINLEKEIDALACKLYSLNSDDKKVLGIE
jgi:type I restriction-modification system DNA methylase subunit